MTRLINNDYIYLTIKTNKMKRLEGFKTHRHETNPKEKELHDKFVSEFIERDGFLHDLLVFAPANDQQTKAVDTLTEREMRIFITAIQWIGTPLGQSLLRECGFVPDQTT